MVIWNGGISPAAICQTSVAVPEVFGTPRRCVLNSPELISPLSLNNVSASGPVGTRGGVNVPVVPVCVACGGLLGE
jgi:hypothetical protein